MVLQHHCSYHDYQSTTALYVSSHIFTTLSLSLYTANKLVPFFQNYAGACLEPQKTAVDWIGDTCSPKVFRTLDLTKKTKLRIFLSQEFRRRLTISSRQQEPDPSPPSSRYKKDGKTNSRRTRIFVTFYYLLLCVVSTSLRFAVFFRWMI